MLKSDENAAFYDADTEETPLERVLFVFGYTRPRDPGLQEGLDACREADNELFSGKTWTSGTWAVGGPHPMGTHRCADEPVNCPAVAQKYLDYGYSRCAMRWLKFGCKNRDRTSCSRLNELGRQVASEVNKNETELEYQRDNFNGVLTEPDK